MPHVIVKMYAGRSDTQKFQLAEAITKALMASADCTRGAVSVGIEDVPPEAWTDAVYKPDIVAKPATLYKKPGYIPL
jgi:4-oxalocrotonate tautomerase